MHSVHLISVEQYNCACLRFANCSVVCWEEGMGGGGKLVFHEVGTMSPGIGGEKCGLIASNERDVPSFLRLQRLLAHSLPHCCSRRACLRSYVHFVRVCVYMCMCVCVRT